MDKIGGRDWEEVKLKFVGYMPFIENYAGKAFRGYRQQQREELIHDTISNAWKGYCQAIEGGKDPEVFIKQIAKHAVLHTKSRRFIDGQENVRDVMSDRCKQRYGVVRQAIPDHAENQDGEPLGELADSRHVSPAHQAAFAMDTADYLCEKSPRDEAIIMDMVSGASNQELVDKYGATASAYSQRRRKYHGELSEIYFRR